MFRSFDFREDTPRDIFVFEGLWLLFMVLNMSVVILMYDRLVTQMGSWGAGVFDTALIGCAGLLMFYTSRRRSNLARWLLVIASVLLGLPYLAYLIVAMRDQPAGYLSLLQIAVQLAALVCLFTHMSRDWFAGRPAPGMPLEDL